MRHLARVAIVLAVVASAAFGSDTKLTTTYRDPSVGKLAFTKVVVAFISPDADLRRRVEGGLARRVRNSVTARAIVPDTEIGDRTAVAARLASNGVDGILVVRLVSFDRDIDATSGEAVMVTDPTLWGVWNASWGVVTMPGYVVETKVVTVEMAVYDVNTTKLIWSGRLKATDPKSLRLLLDDLVKEGAAELKNQKLI